MNKHVALLLCLVGLSAGPVAAQSPAASAAEVSAPAVSPAPAPAAPAAAPAAADDMAGTAAWYGRKFAGRRTASGQRFNPAALTAAHPTLPFGTRVKVTNQANQRSVVVTINDRGPTSPGRVIDVSLAAARRLGFVRAGLTEVTLEVVGQAKARDAKS